MAGMFSENDRQTSEFGASCFLFLCEAIVHPVSKQSTAKSQHSTRSPSTFREFSDLAYRKISVGRKNKEKPRSTGQLFTENNVSTESILQKKKKKKKKNEAAPWLALARTTHKHAQGHNTSKGSSVEHKPRPKLVSCSPAFRAPTTIYLTIYPRIL